MKMRLTITESQWWLISYAMTLLTSPDGQRRLLADYPEVDLDAVHADQAKLYEILKPVKPEEQPRILHPVTGLVRPKGPIHEV